MVLAAWHKCAVKGVDGARTSDGVTEGSWISWLNFRPWPKTLLSLKKAFAALKEAGVKVSGMRPSNWRLHFCAEVMVKTVRREDIESSLERDIVSTARQ